MACCIRPSGATVGRRARIHSCRQVRPARSCRSIRHRLRIHWQSTLGTRLCSVGSGLLAVPRASVPLRFSRTLLPIRESCEWSILVPLSLSRLLRLPFGFAVPGLLLSLSRPDSQTPSVSYCRTGALALPISAVSRRRAYSWQRLHLLIPVRVRL